jgi:hypothetical protein
MEPESSSPYTQVPATTTSENNNKPLIPKPLAFLHYLSFRLLYSYILILRPFLPIFQATN